MRARVTEALYRDARQNALLILGGAAMTRAKSRQQLVESYAVRDRTADAYVDCYIALRRGQVYKSTVSADGLRFFLRELAGEGQEALLTALEAVEAHINYLEQKRSKTTGKVVVERGLRAVMEEFQREAAVPDLAGLERAFYEEVERAIRDTAENRAARLRHAPKKPEVRVVTTRVYTRNAYVVAEVLARADGLCEGCQRPAPFRRADGRPYLEVHHVVQLAHGGLDSVENAIALCPNCHRQRHFGVPAVATIVGEE